MQVSRLLSKPEPTYGRLCRRYNLSGCICVPRSRSGRLNPAGGCAKRNCTFWRQWRFAACAFSAMAQASASGGGSSVFPLAPTSSCSLPVLQSSVLTPQSSVLLRSGPLAVSSAPPRLLSDFSASVSEHRPAKLICHAPPAGSSFLRVCKHLHPDDAC